jgi:hypothetical protein
MKLLVKNSVILVPLIIVGHLLVYWVVGKRSIPEMIPRISEAAQDGLDVVYMGDSCVIDIAPDDVDRRNLAEMLNQRLPQSRVESVAHYAYHGELFEGIGHVLAEGSAPPKVVVVPINMRSFSLIWDQRPEFQFPRVKFLLEHRSPWARITLKPLIVFRYIDTTPVTQREFEAMPVYVAMEKQGTVRDYDYPLGEHAHEDYFQKQFLYTYAYPLDKKHRKLQGLLQTIRILREAGIAPVVYITPLDYQSAVRYSGVLLDEQLNKNIQLVLEVFREEGVEVIDLSRALDPEAFCYDQYVHEHLDQRGRLLVVEKVAKAVGQILENDAGDEAH